MAKARPIVGVSMVLITTTALVGEGKQLEVRQPTVFVHIENYAAVPPEIIKDARKQLAHIYDAARVRVESSATRDHSGCADRFTIHAVLLAGGRADRYIRTAQVNGNVLALASSEARRIYVFVERVGVSADRQAIARGDALGVVMAHELGHVLLPGRRHSTTGIMQENYNVYFSYGLKFTADESAVMRAFIDARGNAQRGRP